MKRTILLLLLLCLTALCLTGCRLDAAPAADPSPSPANMALADYLASVEAQAGAIRAALEQDALTQADMNQKSGELSALWDAAMSRMLEEAEKTLPTAEMQQLTVSQNAWLAARAQSVEAAGKEFDGGSMYALVVNTESAKLTEARVHELYALLK